MLNKHTLIFVKFLGEIKPQDYFMLSTPKWDKGLLLNFYIQIKHLIKG